jgi:hypothetical protein
MAAEVAQSSLGFAEASMPGAEATNLETITRFLRPVEGGVTLRP